MAAPVDSARQGTNITTASTSHAINVGSPVSGTLLIVAVRFAGAPGSITFTGYNLLASDDTDASDDALAVFYRWANGSEGATDTLTTGSNVKLAAICWEVTGAANPSTHALTISSAAQGTTSANTANPGSAAVNAGPRDALYIAVGSGDGEVGAYTAAPGGGYTNLVTANSGTGGNPATNCFMGGASLGATNSTSNDPGAFTHGAHSNGWSAYTVAIRTADASNFTGAGAPTYTVGSTAVGRLQAYGAAVRASAFTGTAVGAILMYGQSALATTFGGTAVGRIGRNGAAELATTFTGTSAGIPQRFAQAALTETIGRTAVGLYTAKGAASLTETINRTADGVRGVLGQGALALTDTITAAGESSAGSHIPLFVDAQAGATSAGGGWTYTCQAAGAAGRVFIVHIFSDEGGSVASVVGTNIENIAGTDNEWTLIAAEQLQFAGYGYHYVYIGRSLSTSAPTISGSNTGNFDLYIRSYQFSGVAGGTTLADVIENGTAGSYTAGIGSVSPISATDVVTLGSDRLALNFFGANDGVQATDLTAMTGESGGDWTYPVTAYGTEDGTDGTVALVTAPIASAGTITGGSDAFTTSAAWGAIGFALKPVPGPATFEGAAVFAGTITGTVVGTPTRFAQAALAETVNRTAVASLTKLGVSALVTTINRTAVGQRTVLASAALGETFASSAVGKSTRFASASLIEEVNLSGVGIPTRFASAALAETVTRSAAGTRTTFGQAARGITISMSGTAVTAATWFGASAVALTFSGSAQGVRTAVGSTALGLTASITSTGLRSVLASASLTETLNRSAIGTPTLFAQAALVGTFNGSASGIREVLGAATLPLVTASSASASLTVFGSSGLAAAFTALARPTGIVASVVLSDQTPWAIDLGDSTPLEITL